MKQRLEIKTTKSRKYITSQILSAVRDELSIFDEEYKIYRDDYEHYSEITIQSGSYMFSWPEINRVQQAFNKFYERYGIRFLTISIHATQTYTSTYSLPISTPYIRISVNEI